MSYCEACKGEHQPKRRIGAQYLGPLWFASIFAGLPGIAEEYCRWARQWKPEQSEGVTDEELLESLKVARGGLRDLVHGVIDPQENLLAGAPTRFLVLRDTSLTDTARVVTAVSDDPLCNVAIGFSTEEGEMTAVNWLVSDADAHGLADGLRERLGEPDMDIAADHHASEQMAEAFQEHAIHTHKE